MFHPDIAEVMKIAFLSSPVTRTKTYGLLSACCFLTLFISCSETPSATTNILDEPKRNVDDYYILKEQPLDTIRHYISGKWQLHYSYGGFTGHTRIDYPDSFIDFGSGNSVYWIRNNELYADTPVTWTWGVDMMGDSTYTMRPFSWCVWGVKGDTLALYDNGNDGMGHLLSRISDGQ